MIVAKTVCTSNAATVIMANICIQLVSFILCCCIIHIVIEMLQWFSESGKLVERLFAHIHEVSDDPDCLVCILIDEVSDLYMTYSI
jgi:hypothetical protein